MSSAKLHIDLRQGILQVEGDEGLVREIYGDFKERIQNASAITPANVANGAFTPKVQVSSPQSAVQSTEKTKKKSSTGSAKGSYSVVKEFHDGEEGKKFLTEMKKYTNPFSHQQKVALFIYVMQRVGIEGISINHVFTCYRLLTDKTPDKADLRNIINNAKHKRAWIIIDSWDDLKIHHKGEEMIEGELLLKEQAA